MMLDEGVVNEWIGGVEHDEHDEHDEHAEHGESDEHDEVLMQFREKTDWYVCSCRSKTYQTRTEHADGH